MSKLVKRNPVEMGSRRLTRDNYSNFIRHRLDDYSDLEYTPEQARKIHQHILKLSTGTSAVIPLYCGSELCPFKDSCPFFQIGQAPKGKQCLVEVQLLEQWTIDYMEEFDVDPQNRTEVGYVNELASLDIMERRLNINLAKGQNAELVVDTPMGVDREGDPIIQKQISPFVELKDKLASRRSKIIKLMVGDRQEKYKKEAALKVKLEEDSSSQQSAMRAQIEKLTRQLDKAGKQVPSSENILSPEDIIDASDE